MLWRKIMDFSYFLLALGFVIFFILPAIFALITAKGCTRIAQTKARFTLDSMTAKLAANDQTAKLKSDFYSRLDGDAKLFSKIEIVGLCLFVLLVILSTAFAVLGKVNAKDCFLPEILGGFLFCVLSAAANLAISFICQEK